MAKKKVSKKQKEFKGGIIVSHGISMGKAYVLSNDTPYIPRYSIIKSQIAQELSRLDTAITKTQQDIKQIKASIDSDLVRENLGYLDAHLLILNDPLLHSRIKTDIHEKLMNVEIIFGDVVNDLIMKMGTINNQYLRDRAEDLRDIHKAVLLNLLGKRKEDLKNMKEDVVIIASNLLPSQTASMDKKHVKAIISEMGGQTSHTAILARSLEIPAVVGMHGMIGEVNHGDYVILDANHGIIIVNPDKATIKEYKTAKHVFDRFLKKLAFLNELPAETTDNVQIKLFANIEIYDEVNSIKDHGAEGIGLMRSEFIFMNDSAFPTEEEQYQIYKNIIRKVGNLPVIIRTIDIGGDKLSYEHRVYQEANPFLGWRSIRFCLSRPKIFKQQLRALFRASTEGSLSIMLPMISGVDELLEAKKIINQVKDDLDKENIPYEKDVKIGIMIEVPSAVIVADELAKHADFFSIGTNDLIQYTIAVDRGNEKISYLFKALHPSVLRLIKMTVDSGKRNNITVEMCGEMAGNPLYTVLLMGLGVCYMSMSSLFIPEVKKIIRSTSFKEAQDFANRVLSMNSTSEIENYLMEYMRKHYPEVIEKIL